MENLTMPQKLVLGGLGLIVIIILIFYVFTKENSTIYAFEGENNLIESTASNNTTAEKIVIHIAGEVEKEGIVELPSNSRISDAINAAGGLKEEANLAQINLASILKDGQKIYIPNIEEAEKTEQGQGETSVFTQSNGKVNINTATQTELETLSGIGASTALKIINYRKENGNFSDIEEIKNVSGIGDAKFNSIKDSICVD